MGVPRGERAARLEESVRIIKALWPGEPVTLRGRFWSLTDVTLTPRPRRAKLEIWLGGSAPAALRRIGRIADGWLASFVSPEEFATGVDLIRATAAEHGRAIDEDHYGMTIFSAPAADEIPAAAAALLDRRPGLARADHVAAGLDGHARAARALPGRGRDEVRADPAGPRPRRVAARAVPRGDRAARGRGDTV